MEEDTNESFIDRIYAENKRRAATLNPQLKSLKGRNPLVGFEYVFWWSFLH